MHLDPGKEERTALAPTLALVAAAVVWGATFVVIKEALGHIGPFEFLALRFSIATVALVVVWPSHVRKVFDPDLRMGWIVGIALAAGYGFQTAGLRYTSATNAGFITGLYVVFTPVLAAVLLRKAPSFLAGAGVILATSGLGLLSLQGRTPLNIGDLLVLACALAFAAQIVLLGRYAPSRDVRGLLIQQLAITSVIFAVLTPFEGPRLPTSGQVWFAIVFTAVAATALGIGIQTWVQSRISATRAALIMTTEPVFAGLFAVWVLSERLSPTEWMGAGLILSGMVISEAGPGANRRRLRTLAEGG